ncbi:helix-turn-helix domain-containing protein [Olivibacter sp. SDN3]|nr:helix-turn-helix domain-containing protein [Olivibacter sp. SDN3]QNL52678.1 helix-turn-helix domain-containing protein [Olivibacter sp. SDN3]
MATIEFITKEDLEKFKKELFAELKRPAFGIHKKQEQKEWLKSYEVRNLLGISAGTLQTLRRNGTLRYSKIGGLMYYKYEDILDLMNTQ